MSGQWVESCKRRKRTSAQRWRRVYCPRAETPADHHSPTSLKGDAEGMIVRLTAKLGKKIGVVPSRLLPADKNPFADWSAHLFTADRTQYILVSNTVSLYSMLMYGRGITDDNWFLQRVTNTMGELMQDDGYQFIYERIIAPETARILFSKALNRSVTGSMNELVYQAQMLLTEKEMSPYDASFKLNEVLLSYLNYDHPRNAFGNMQPQK